MEAWARRMYCLVLPPQKPHRPTKQKCTSTTMVTVARSTGAPGSGQQGRPHGDVLAPIVVHALLVKVLHSVETVLPRIQLDPAIRALAACGVRVASGRSMPGSERGA